MEAARAKLHSRCQKVPVGEFTLSDLHWTAVTSGNAAGNEDAIIPLELVHSLIKGEEKKGICKFCTTRIRRNEPETLTQPKETSYLVSTDLHCHFGPEDYREGTSDHKAFIQSHQGMAI